MDAEEGVEAADPNRKTDHEVLEDLEHARVRQPLPAACGLIASH